MGKESVSQGPLDPACRSQEEKTPHVSKPADHQSNAEDLKPIGKKMGRDRVSYGEIINRMFDHPWDEKLKHIHDKKGNEPQENSPPVLPKIFFECGVGFHPRSDFSNGFDLL
jgi:hypothetical protein